MQISHEELMAALEMLESNVEVYDEMIAAGESHTAEEDAAISLIRSFVKKTRAAIFEANSGLREEALEAIEKGQMN